MVALSEHKVVLWNKLKLELLCYESQVLVRKLVFLLEKLNILYHRDQLLKYIFVSPLL